TIRLRSSISSSAKGAVLGMAGAMVDPSQCGSVPRRIAIRTAIAANVAKTSTPAERREWLSLSGDRCALHGVERRDRIIFRRKARYRGWKEILSYKIAM